MLVLALFKADKEPQRHHSSQRRKVLHILVRRWSCIYPQASSLKALNKACHLLSLFWTFFPPKKSLFYGSIHIRFPINHTRNHIFYLETQTLTHHNSNNTK